MYIDSHCHLAFPELHDRLGAILADMRAAEVGGALCICTRMEEFEAVHALAAGHDNLWASVGVHPDTEGETEPDVDALCALASRPRVVAIGETGLDYFRLEGRSIADMEWQRERFRVHIRAGRRMDLPLVIHTRQASDDTLAILRQEAAAASERTVFEVRFFGDVMGDLIWRKSRAGRQGALSGDRRAWCAGRG